MVVVVVVVGLFAIGLTALGCFWVVRAVRAQICAKAKEGIWQCGCF